MSPSHGNNKLFCVFSINYNTRRSLWRGNETGNGKRWKWIHSIVHELPTLCGIVHVQSAGLAIHQQSNRSTSLSISVPSWIYFEHEACSVLKTWPYIFLKWIKCLQNLLLRKVSGKKSWRESPQSTSISKINAQYSCNCLSRFQILVLMKVVSVIHYNNSPSLYQS